MAETIREVTIPWADQEFYGPVFLQVAESFGITLDRVYHVEPAIKEFTTVKHPLILMNFCISPTLDELRDEPIAEILRGEESPKHWRLGTYVLRKTREEGSVNRETPIFVVSSYEPVTDKRCSNAREKALWAGASKFYSIPSVAFGDIMKDVRKVLDG